MKPLSNYISDIESDDPLFEENIKEVKNINYLKVKRLGPSSIVPLREPGWIGCDLHSVEYYGLKPNECRAINTGIAIELPSGHYGRIFARPSIIRNNQIDVKAGVNDPGYKGEIKVFLHNFSD